MKNSKNSSKSNPESKISMCDVMKENTSRIIKKLESQIPVNLQQSSDLYSAYLHTLEDFFDSCYVSEKEFLDKLNINQGILEAYQKYSHTLTGAFLTQIDFISIIKEQNIQTQKSNLEVYDKFMHSMLDSYAKYLSQYNKIISPWFYSNNFKNQ